MPVAWIEDSKTGATRAIDDIMRDVLIFVYGKHGTVRAAAEAIGVSRSTFSKWCQQLGVATERAGQKGTKIAINFNKTSRAA